MLNGDIERLEFYNNDQELLSVGRLGRSNENILLSLPSGVKTEWKHKEAFRPVEGTLTQSVTNVSKIR